MKVYALLSGDYEARGIAAVFQTREHAVAWAEGHPGEFYPKDWEMRNHPEWLMGIPADYYDIEEHEVWQP